MNNLYPDPETENKWDELEELDGEYDEGEYDE